MHNLQDNIAPDFKLGEFLTSPGALAYLESLPPEKQAVIYNNIVRLAQVLQSFRDLLGVPFKIVDGLRSPAHNATVPGAATKSFHLDGSAADFTIPAKYTQRLIWLLHHYQGGWKFYKDGHFHVDTGPKRTW